MKPHWPARSGSRGRLGPGLSGSVILLLLLAGCRTTAANPGSTPVPTTVAAAATVAPVVTQPPTVTAVPPSPTPLPPTSTPDLTLLPEQYEHPQGLFRLHHPTGWEVEDLSNEREVLVSFRAPGQESPAIFVVNFINPGGQLTDDQVPTLSESYLDNFFREQADLVTLERETLPDGTVRVVASGQGESPEQQLHLEFRFTQRAPLFQTLILISSEAAWPETRPLLSTMADSLQVDLAQAGLVPAVGAASDQPIVEGLTLVNDNHFTAGTGSLYVVGEVHNTSDETYQEVEVTVYLLDSTGTALASETWGAKTGVLRPGETSPVLVIFDQPPSEWAEIRTEIRANPADFYLTLIYPDLTISQDTGGVPTFGDYRITGTIMNSGEDNARAVEIVGTLYDEAGAVLAVESTFLPQDTLEPGQSATFELVFFGKADGEVARYQVAAQGIRAEVQE